MASSKTKDHKSVPQTLVYTLQRATKKGVTAAVLVQRTGLKPNTVRSTLTKLVREEAVKVSGTVKTDKRGRPAHLYVI